MKQQLEKRVLPSPAATGRGAAARGSSNLLKMIPGRLATQAVLTVSVFVIARLLGSEAYGRYAAIMAVVAILQTASSGGLPMVEVRYLSPLWQAGRKRAAVRLGSTIWAVRLALVGVAAVMAALWLARSPELGLEPWICASLGVFCFFRFGFEANRSLLLPIGHAGMLVVFELLRAASTLPLVASAFVLFGLEGVFIGLPLLYAGLFVLTYVVLIRALPVRAALFEWSELRPHVGYSFSTFVGTLASMVQAQLAVYAVGRWVAGREAGYLALSVQFFAICQGLFQTCQRALLPVLAELEESGDERRLRQWGGVMLRYSAALSCVACVGWALVGEGVVHALLGEEFGPVYGSVTIILLGVVFYSCALSCNGLLYIRGMARTASFNTILFAGLTLAGLVLTLSGAADGVARRICWVYTAAALAFWVSAYLTLGRRSGLWLSLGRAVLLIVPAFLAWPALHWSAPYASKVLVAAGFVVLYMAYAVRLHLLPAEEAGQILDTVRRRGVTKAG